MSILNGARKQRLRVNLHPNGYPHTWPAMINSIYIIKTAIMNKNTVFEMSNSQLQAYNKNVYLSFCVSLASFDFNPVTDNIVHACFLTSVTYFLSLVSLFSFVLKKTFLSSVIHRSCNGSRTWKSSTSSSSACAVTWLVYRALSCQTQKACWPPPGGRLKRCWAVWEFSLFRLFTRWYGKVICSY